MTEFRYDPLSTGGGVIFDTHAHYDDPAFDNDRSALLERLGEWGVCGVINCACSERSAATTLELAHSYDFIYAALGLHPEENEPYDEGWISAGAADEKCVAVGEIGLDYHWDSVQREEQKKRFKGQLELAGRLKKPVIIHSRDAAADTLSIVTEYTPRGVLHCFSGSLETAKSYVDLGMYLGFGGAATFKNARKAAEVIAGIPLERLLLETDAPYMAPEPYRGSRCHSAMIIRVAERIADIKAVSVRRVLDVTRENARELFGV